MYSIIGTMDLLFIVILIFIFVYSINIYMNGCHHCKAPETEQCKSALNDLIMVKDKSKCHRLFEALEFKHASLSKMGVLNGDTNQKFSDLVDKDLYCNGLDDDTNRESVKERVKIFNILSNFINGYTHTSLLHICTS